MAHITWTVDEVAEEKDVPLTEGTFLFDPNLIGWFDLIYDVLELELGSSIEVPVLSPSDLEARVITIAVRPQLEEIEVGGVMLQAFVCDLTLSGKQEIHYVLLDGTLLRIERPTEEWLAKSVTIERVS